MTPHRAPLLNRLLGPCAALLMGAALLAIFLYAPVERSQGIVQKIFYLHVPSAWVGFLAFFVVFVASVLYLWKREVRYDVIAHASAEVGVVFTTCVLLTGPLWGKPIWGAWWVWDSRLTTTLVLWLIYVAYLMLRAYGGEGAQVTRFAAVLGIVGFLDVPLIHLSVEWWRTLHPSPVVLRSEGFGTGLPPEMLRTLLLCLVAFTLLYADLLLMRIGIGRAREDIDHLRKAVGA